MHIAPTDYAATLRAYITNTLHGLKLDTADIAAEVRLHMPRVTDNEVGGELYRMAAKGLVAYRAASAERLVWKLALPRVAAR
ncbi:MAG: hypothetical protein VR70_14445 [Rhodospirillaceae bacterium BRH_c57]|nr:MAG: hypothetical protein VR70_14445 [Rhodospirillaceae bacterium BRH_c57]